MQTLIDELFEHVKERYHELFNIRKDWERVMNRFKSICFLGEVDKNLLFVSMLHQVINTRTGKIKNLTLAESEEFVITGDIIGLEHFAPFAWTFWKLDMATGYISVFTSFKGRKDIGPKANYIASFDQIKLFEKQNLVFEATMRKLRPMDQAVFKKLIDIIEFSKTNHVDEFQFDQKVFYDMSKYFGIINNKGLVDSDYVETNRPELIKANQRHTEILIRKDQPMTNLLRGNSYKTINYETNAEVRTYDSYKDLHNFMYSLINYINKNNKLLGLNQQIYSLQKHWYSNQWDNPVNDETRAAARTEYVNLTLEIPAINTDLNAIKLETDKFKTVQIAADYHLLEEKKEAIRSLQRRLFKIDNKITNLQPLWIDELPTVENNAKMLSQYIDLAHTLDANIKATQKPYTDDQGRDISAAQEEQINAKKLTKYVVSVTKFQDKIAIRADIWEYGLCYYITNFNSGVDPWGDTFPEKLPGKPGSPLPVDPDEDLGDNEYILPGEEQPHNPEDDCYCDPDENKYHDILTVSDELTWKRAISEINSGGNKKKYLVNIINNFTLNLHGDNFTFPQANNIDVEFRGSYIITLICCCRVLTLKANQKVTLNNLKFNGYVNKELMEGKISNTPFSINNGTLILKGNTEIRNCSNRAIYCDGGIIEMMEDSSIHHNSAVQGGGIYIKAGSLIMSGFSTIKNNVATDKGGGVFYIEGSLSMKESARIYGADTCGVTNVAKNGAAIWGYIHTSNNTVPKLANKECHCGKNDCPICCPKPPAQEPDWPDPVDPPTWGDPEYTVIFVSNGANSTPLKQIVVEGRLVAVPDDITKDGHTFMGWYSDESCNTLWNFQEDKVMEDLVLYAKWIEIEVPVDPPEPVKKHLVIFMDGLTKLSEVQVEEGKVVLEPGNPEKEGFKFIYWYKEATFENMWDFEENVIMQDTVIYAKFEKDEVIVQPTVYTVQFETNGGSPKPLDQHLNEGSLVVKPANPTKEGFKFIDWFTDLGLVYNWDFAGRTVNSNVILYAKWETVSVVIDGQKWTYGLVWRSTDSEIDLDARGFEYPLQQEMFAEGIDAVKIYLNPITSQRPETWPEGELGFRIPNLDFENIGLLESKMTDGTMRKVPNVYSLVDGFTYDDSVKTITIQGGGAFTTLMRIVKDK